MLKTSFQNSVLMIIDMQETFLRSINLEKRKNFIDSSYLFIDYFVDKNLPIINVTSAYNYGLDPKINSLISSYSKIHPVEKFHSDAFRERDLLKLMNELGSKNIFFCGVYAGCCVAQTMLSASKKYDVFTAEDIICDDDESIIKKLGSLSAYDDLDYFSKKSLFMSKLSKLSSFRKEELNRQKINFQNSKYDLMEILCGD